MVLFNNVIKACCIYGLISIKADTSYRLLFILMGLICYSIMVWNSY